MTWFKYPGALAAFLRASEEAEPLLDAVEEELGPKISALEAELAALQAERDRRVNQIEWCYRLGELRAAMLQADADDRAARSHTLGPWEQPVFRRFIWYLMRSEPTGDRRRESMAWLRAVNWIRPDGTRDFSVVSHVHPQRWVLDLVPPPASRAARERLSGPLCSDAAAEEAQAWADEQLRARGWILLAPEDAEEWLKQATE